MEPTFLGLAKSEWDLFNGFANWFSAFASLAAAVVALYIANRASRPTGTLTVGHRISIGPGSQAPYPQFAVFRFVNTGDRPIRITQIGWKVGLRKKRFAVQMYEPTLSSRMPVDLAHGQEAAWYVPIDRHPDPWPESFAKKMLLPDYRWSLRTLRAQAFSSVGFVFEAKPESNLLQPLKEACEKAS